ncbi:MAG: hypothetical protein RL701_4674, partial [Pseudomonadota bacterium]
NFAIPPPPAGENLDPSKVNVGYTAPGAPAEKLFGKVTDQTACSTEPGWHYDNAADPKQVMLCPSACDQVSGGGTVGIAFGCETIILF